MKVKMNVKAGSRALNNRAPVSWMVCAAAVLTIGRPASAAVVDISAGPSGWGCSQCSGPQNVLPGTVVNLVNTGEPGPLQLTLDPGTYTITNAATTGNYSAWNFEGYPSSANWVWSFMIGADHGNGTATVLKDDFGPIPTSGPFTNGIFGTQAEAAAATGTTWDGRYGIPADLLPGTSTAGFIDTLTLTNTTTLDFFVDDYALGDNGGGVALNIASTGTSAPEPVSLVLIGAGLVALPLLRKRASAQSLKTLATVSLLMLPGAFAQNLRSWVSSTGSDSNNCSRSAPCATFQGALANTNSGGEIDVVDAGDYGAVVISQSVTIDGGGMGRIASTAPGHNNFDLGDGIQVTSGNVSLLNLSILPSSGASRGVYVWFGAGSVSIRNVHISGFPEGVTTDGPQTVVTDSLIEGVGTALFCRGTNCAFRNDSLIDNSGYGIKLADAATALIDSCLITNSGVALQSGTGFDSGGTAQLTNTTITNNTVGMQAFGGGSIISFVNNRIYGNGTNGAPTSSVFQK